MAAGGATPAGNLLRQSLYVPLGRPTRLPRRSDSFLRAPLPSTGARAGPRAARQGAVPRGGVSPTGVRSPSVAGRQAARGRVSPVRTQRIAGVTIEQPGVPWSMYGHLLPRLHYDGKRWTYGNPQPEGYVFRWAPVRYVQHEQVCIQCWDRIPPGSPGSTRGTRGTKAFCEPRVGLWLHIECKEERERWRHPTSTAAFES